MSSHDSKVLNHYAGAIMIALVLLGIASALFRAEQNDSLRLSLEAPHKSIASDAEPGWQLWQGP